MGDNRGTGFDPAFDASRRHQPQKENPRFITDVFSAKHSAIQADFICCRMTLEHVPQTAKFLTTVRRFIGAREGCGVFFMVPDTTRILNETSFWDIYYEHCSLFTAVSLPHLFHSCGFQVTRLERVYGGQYLTVDAVSIPSGRTEVHFPGALSAEKSLRFEGSLERTTAAWKAKLTEARGRGRSTVLWGGGSKAVAFLTALKLTDEIDGAVDINPRKQGTYLPGSGHRVIAPDDLRRVQPDLVVVMNPSYMGEIRGELHRLGLEPEVEAAAAFTASASATQRSVGIASHFVP
jgi:hypothetical protein